MPGARRNDHFASSAAFTATAMIGFIALAGIIVRNSILLVELILWRRAEEFALRQAMLEPG
jgi:multidrug efflux pump subunit AcrB